MPEKILIRLSFFSKQKQSPDFESLVSNSFKQNFHKILQVIYINTMGSITNIQYSIAKNVFDVCTYQYALENNVGVVRKSTWKFDLKINWKMHAFCAVQHDLGELF
jgi:hypothetical protein